VIWIFNVPSVPVIRI